MGTNFLCYDDQPSALPTCSDTNGRIVTAIYLNWLQPEKFKMFEPANYPETRAERRKRERSKEKKHVKN